MKKILSLVLALALLASCLCLTVASAEQGDSVVVGIAGDPGNIGPFQAMSAGRIGILFTTYEFLVTKDGDTNPGVLMKELTQVDDLTYDVEIYDYIVDQAGNPLTASDVKFCYETAQSIGNLPKLSSIESVEVISDYVCRFHFKELAAGDLYSLLMECPIVTQAAYEASPDQMATDPVTTSPYRVTSYQTGSKITMEYTGAYWQTDESLVRITSKHNVNNITFSIIPDSVQLTNALKTKEIDISSAIDAAYIKDFMDVEGYAVTRFPDSLTKFLVFNNNVFPDQRVRQGIAYGIDVDDINLFAFDGLAMPAKTIGNSKYPDYLASWDEEEYYEYDAEKAKALFAEAGFTGGTYVFTNSGVYNTGRLGAKGLRSLCRTVPDDQAQPGDIVFFEGTMGADVAGITHCGIYVGNGMMLHCGNPIGYADLSDAYWQTHFHSFGRVPN